MASWRAIASEAISLTFGFIMPLILANESSDPLGLCKSILTLLVMPFLPFLLVYSCSSMVIDFRAGILSFGISFDGFNLNPFLSQDAKSVISEKPNFSNWAIISASVFSTTLLQRARARYAFSGGFDRVLDASVFAVFPRPSRWCAAHWKSSKTV